MNGHRFDAVIILGGGRNNLDGSLTQLSKAKLDAGAATIKNGIADHAVVMGKVYKSYTPDKGFFEKEGALLRKEYLIAQHGINPSKIETIIDECMDTFYEALASRKLAKEKGYKRILLATSTNHMRRSLFIFKRIYGEDAEVMPIENPCEDSLNPQLEKVLFEIAERFFAALPEKIPDLVSWDTWFENNRKVYYEEVIKTFDDFQQKGQLSKEAYSSIYPSVK